MSPQLPSTYNQIVLRERPKSSINPSLTDGSGTFSLEKNLPMPQQSSLDSNELLIKVEYCSVDPAMRGWLNNARSYVPPVQIGEVMRALCVGKVVLKGKGSKFEVGDWVSGTLGWREYAKVNEKHVEKIHVTKDIGPTYYLSVISMVGQTAYWGMFDVGKISSGQTVVVSGAAGAVGSLACQFALITGCKVIAIAGGKDKCRWLKEEVGCHEVVDYKDKDFVTTFKKSLGKGGIDVYFDNVGGEILDLCLTRLNKNAIVALCGAISAYNDPTPRGLQNYLTLISQRASIQGFIVFDYADRYQEAAEKMGQWIAEGKLKVRETIEYGLTQAPNALVGLFAGANQGKMIVKFSDEGSKL